jgi:carboxyl-terminal processing protease
MIKFSDLKNLVVIGLVFVLGVIIGQKYLNSSSVSFLSNSLSKNQGQQLLNSAIVEGVDAPSNLRTVDFQQFWEVWQIIEKEYLEPEKIDRQEMVYGAIQGLTSALGDAYTMYLPPEQDKRAAEDLAGSFYGVGIELGYIDGILAIVAPLRGMPAEQAGAQAGDLILKVKDEAKGLDEETTDWSLSKAVDSIRGEKNTQVQLTLARPSKGGEVFELTIPRGEVVISSVELEFIERDQKKYAQVILSRFGDRTLDEWNEAVAKIVEQGSTVDAVILDMRNNPGGYFEEAIFIVSEFAVRGNVVSQKGRYGTTDFPVNRKGKLQGKEVVILVNQGSASASEIVAGALRDLVGAKLVGQPTFGKGTVQDRRQLPGGAGLHITIAKWLLPNGDSIPEEGLTVDHEATDDPNTDQDEVVITAIDVL